ncbi:hypothetical protein BCR44DRAFT_1440675 [Catenaria anguillulae PL171]|uniref:Uncharacterized protein n=1 Tax=Catenaria anguillulae PL171 TaxID=765915 RepID=A0A1Y2HC97_9FUNG|nr:hypothetical protein BCR44DRAFT_1440675 [Catenaria anguillulae PL171]
MSDPVLPPIPANHYSSLLSDMSTALDTLGLAAQPLTSAALHSDPLLSPLVGRVLAQHAADAVANAIANSRPDVNQILQQDDAHKLHPEAKKALEWIGTLPTCQPGSTVQTFLKDALAEHVVADKTQEQGESTTEAEAEAEAASESGSSYTAATDNKDNKRSPALLPAHALPLFYLMRPVLLAHLWPRSVMGPVLSGERKDVLPLVEQDMERVLSNAYVNISVQTHLLALYGGSVEFLALLVAGEDGQEGQDLDEEEDEDSEGIDAVADQVKDMGIAGDVDSEQAAAELEVAAQP